MTPALVLVDVQNDFLERPDLAPPRETLVAAAARLLAGARERGVPVVHVHTLVRSDGGDAMPHWARRGVRACRRGTAGALPPAELAPRAGEAVVEKRFYSPFGVPAMDEALRALGADTLIVAGLYLHGCVRAAILDGYERGYEILVDDEAVASTDPAHAELSRAYLVERAAAFLPTDAILARLDAARGGAAAAGGAGGGRGAGTRTGQRTYRHRNPARLDEILEEVPIGGADEVDAAVAAAEAARTAVERLPGARRRELLEAWARVIEARRDTFAERIAVEVGKPIADAREEVDRGLAHVRAAAGLAGEDGAERLGEGVSVRHRPHGVVGIVTPFNNPLAIPAAKIAAALAFGNAVVLKPALEAAATTRLLIETSRAAGLPAGAVATVHGDAGTARLLVRHPGVRAVSITGSIATGRSVHALCARDGKPLQAELGGNNAAIVLADADLEAEADALARAAYGFAGQRCTAIRRLIVVRPVLGELVAAFARAAAALSLGEPLASATAVGPLVSPRRRDRVRAAVAEAAAGGARAVLDGGVPAGFERGAWLAPVLLDAVDPGSRVFREETFGPLAVVVPARDLEAAIVLANAVPHGLVAWLASRDPGAKRRFAAAVEAGILRIDRRAPFLHPAAPFGGWKASGVGPPEHGEWDRAFYARPQAVYGALP
jgi:acyl-CoA reductase-like NAD-dependent aldehyde dehydrogenase/nicotinamidase-related amidase